jgi:group I intron endonuclease
MGCGIYKIENLHDKKIYVGSSINIENRKYKHFWMLERNKHDNAHLQYSYNKFGKEFFDFQILEECSLDTLIEKENFYINYYKSNNDNHGYNLAVVNEFRRNTYNDEVKLKLSKYNINKNGNFNKFSLINIKTDVEYIFDNLVEAANYLLINGFAKGKPSYIRMRLSTSLRGKKVNNGKNNNGSIRKTCYKHKFKLIN